MSRHFLGVTRKGFGHARAGQSPRVESRGALDPPLESSCRPMSTPLNHGLEATPGQEPECNLAQHQKENLSAAVSPAKETTEGLIFTDRILKKKARDLNSRQEALDFFCCECPRKEARRGKYEVETNLTATHTGRKRRWAFQGEPPLGLPGGDEGDGCPLPAWFLWTIEWPLLATSAGIQDRQYARSQEVKSPPSQSLHSWAGRLWGLSSWFVQLGPGLLGSLCHRLNQDHFT